MNSLEYKKHMEDNNLIESVESVQNIINAIQVTKNLSNLARYKESKTTLVAKSNMLTIKDSCIRSAIREAYDKDWALDMFGGIYPFQIKELYKNLEPTVASLYVPNGTEETEEYHLKMYAEQYKEWSLANVQ